MDGFWCAPREGFRTAIEYPGRLRVAYGAGGVD